MVIQDLNHSQVFENDDVFSDLNREAIRKLITLQFFRHILEIHFFEAVFDNFSS